MAKRRIEINLDDVTRLAALQCSEAEAAAFFHCSVKKFKEILGTFEDVKQAWDEGREAGKTSLRRKQFRLASTSASMAIHLGKNILGQKDAVSMEHTGRNGGPIENIDLTKLDQDGRDKLRELLIRASQSSSSPKRAGSN